MRNRTVVSAEEVAAYYEANAAHYRACWGEHQHHGYFEGEAGRDGIAEATERLIDRAAAWLRLRSGERVVDIGCGEGGTARRLARRHGVDVDGFTIAGGAGVEDVLLPCGAGRVRLIRRDWMANGVADGAYDAAVSIECLAHVADKRRFFAELARVLRPGGRAAVCCWMTAARVPRLAGRLVLEPAWGSGCVNGVAGGQRMRRWAAEAGLRVERFENWARWTAPTWRAIARRVVWMAATDRRFRRRFVFRPTARDAALALAVPRILLAYRAGWLGYAAMGMVKPGPPGAPA